ncbi:hypothetical protein [Microbacterium rhizophilus]|uniref:hypothetical protein n=1 Tax=Microbacterium rhizophilus TaxID=3138934 RepID=UPI0031F0D98A
MSTPLNRDDGRDGSNRDETYRDEVIREEARRDAGAASGAHVHDDTVTTGQPSPDRDAGRGSDEPTVAYAAPPVDDRSTSGSRSDDADRRRDDRDRDRDDDRDRTSAAPVAGAVSPDAARAARHEVVAREKEEFGGMKFGSAFFGWLSAMGMTVLLTALVAGAGAALGLGAQVDPEQAAQENAETIGIAGAIAVIVILFIAYYCGGYVAGRMARFSGAKQGIAVWLWALIVAIIVAIITAIAGAQWNILANVNTFPRLPFNEGELTTAGIITAVAALLVSLGGAVLGGLAGMRYHRKVDKAGFGR